MTRYNNKTYKIDDLEFGESPMSTFTNSRGQTMTYVEYYRNQYGIEIQDQNQPLLVSRPRRTSAAMGDQTMVVCLIPELCLFTGKT